MNQYIRGATGGQKTRVQFSELIQTKFLSYMQNIPSENYQALGSQENMKSATATVIAFRTSHPSNPRTTALKVDVKSADGGARQAQARYRTTQKVLWVCHRQLMHVYTWKDNSSTLSQSLLRELAMTASQTF